MTEAENAAPQDPGPLAKKLQYLRETVRKDDGSKYTYREIIEGVKANGGPTLSIGYLSQLMNGARKNPMLNALDGLGRFFGQDLSYFDVTPGAPERRKLAVQLESAGVEAIAERAVGLNKGNMDALKSLIDQMRVMQGLPPITTEPEDPDE